MITDYAHSVVLEIARLERECYSRAVARINALNQGEDYVTEELQGGCEGDNGEAH